MSHLKKIFAAVVGVLAAGIAVVAVNAWIRAQGGDESVVRAGWALEAAEAQIVQAVAAVRELSARGVDSCRPEHLEAMRQAALLTAPVKEMVLLASNNQWMCSDTGGQLSRYQLVTSASKPNANIMFDLMRLQGGSERFLRVRNFTRSGKPAVAAMLPVSLLLAQSSVRDGPIPGYVRLTMPGGALIADSGVAPGGAGGAEPQFLIRQWSSQYPFGVMVWMPRRGVIANAEDLRRIAVMTTSVLALATLACVLAYRRRQADNPFAGIAKALLADEFVPYYQPVVDIQTGKLLGAEVLVRWRRSDGSFVEPASFAPLIESSGLALEITRSLMRRVRKDLGEAVGRRPRLTVAFNVVPRHFDDALILNDIGTIFGGSPIKLSQIVLELTERYEVENLTAMRRTVAALQGMGCKIAIDNVGTGHSGLSYILKLGVDIIKIDKIFVEAIGSEGHSKAIIETFIDLAKNMRMQIVAEGVESFDQVTYLRERGIGAAQGHVFAPPLPASSFLKLLEAMDPATDAGVARINTRKLNAA